MSISGSSTTPPAASDVSTLVDEITTTINEHLGDVHPLVLAAWSHWAMTYVHPFRDGNGRVARMIQDYVLLSREQIPVPLSSADREGQYYQALEAADGGDGELLVEMLSKNLLRIADRQLALIREQAEREDWISTITQAATERVRETDHRRFTAWQRQIESIRREFVDTASDVNSRIQGVSVWTNEYEGIDYEKYKELRRTGHAKRTWVLGVGFRHEEFRLRFVFWACGHSNRGWDTDLKIGNEPVLLVSMEELSATSAAPHYRALDDLYEDMISIREIAFPKNGIARRRYDPLEKRDRWDVELTAGQIARDFFTEVMRRLRLA